MKHILLNYHLEFNNNSYKYMPTNADLFEMSEDWRIHENDEDYTFYLEKHLLNLSTYNSIPNNHINYLINLKQSGFEPKVIYDIGSSVLNWTNITKQIWPDAKIFLFDAFQPAEFLYKDFEYHIGVLSDKNDKIVKFYQNNFLPGGNSYYREIFNGGKFFPEDIYIEKVTKTLDTVVEERGFPLPDFIKIDVQGSEIDIINGGKNTINNAKRMIVELQHIEYNLGAKMYQESLEIIKELGWSCCDPLFTNNGPDGDYGFINNFNKN